MRCRPWNSLRHASDALWNVARAVLPLTSSRQEWIFHQMSARLLIVPKICQNIKESSDWNSLAAASKAVWDFARTLHLVLLLSEVIVLLLAVVKNKIQGTILSLSQLLLSAEVTMLHFDSKQNIKGGLHLISCQPFFSHWESHFWPFEKFSKADRKWSSVAITAFFFHQEKKNSTFHHFFFFFVNYSWTLVTFWKILLSKKNSEKRSFLCISKQCFPIQ